MGIPFCEETGGEMPLKPNSHRVKAPLSIDILPCHVPSPFLLRTTYSALLSAVGLGIPVHVKILPTFF